MRLLLVLAAIYDSAGSSDVGRRAEGEHAVSSEAFSVSRPRSLSSFLLPLNSVCEQAPPCGPRR